MRIFFAIPCDQQLKTALVGVQQQLKKTPASVKWVEPDNIHLTLKFIKNFDSNRLPNLCQQVRTVIAEFSATTAKVKECEAYPPRSPRTVWLNVTDKDKTMAALAQGLENICEKFNIPKEDRGFKAHITIGRIRSKEKIRTLIKAIDELPPLKESAFPIDSIHLIQSTLTTTGPVYELIESFPLNYVKKTAGL